MSTPLIETKPSEMHSQYGEYVYEHEHVQARADAAKPCLERAGTDMQSVMDCWSGLLGVVG